MLGRVWERGRFEGFVEGKQELYDYYGGFDLFSLGIEAMSRVLVGTGKPMMIGDVLLIR